MSTSVAAQEANTKLRSGQDNENKFLSFCLGEEEYAIEILRVREIIGAIESTPLPHTPNYVKGVINLRGKIIPVIELRTKFALSPRDYTEETCIIVVDVSDGGDERYQMGVIVDSVREVIDIPKDAIETAPRFGGDLNTSYILGMGKLNDRMLILLDLDRVMSTKDTHASTESSQGNVAPSEPAVAA